MGTTRGTSRLWTSATVACVAAYVAFSAVVGRFPTVDEVFFKAPGRQWAVSERFAAPELTGVPFLEGVSPPIEEVWFVHPPGYPFAFGLFVKLFGFGPTPCVVFDALIHGLLAFLTFLTARGVRAGLPGWVCFLVAMAVLPLGFFGRPDELAMCLGMAGALTLLNPALRLKSVLFSGTMLGLCAATSVGTAVLLGILGLTLFLTDRRRFGYGFVWGLGALTVFALAIAPILLMYPGAYKQYLAHAAVHVGHGDFLRGFFTHWEYEEFHRSITLACLSVGVLGLACRAPDLAWRRWRQLWLGPVLGVAFVAVF